MSYIAFEGGEGSGKSTQAEILANKINAVLTKEPGGTEIGRKIREFLLIDNPQGVDEVVEAYLMAADRAQNIEEIVLPALNQGRVVISDRSIFSSLAYQGYGRGLDIQYIKRLNVLGMQDCWPDYVIFIDVPVDIAMSRIDENFDRFESLSEKFHESVRNGYDKMAADDPDHWIKISGIGSVEEVTEKVEHELSLRGLLTVD